MTRLIAALVLGALAASARAEAPFSFETAAGRLPKNVRPVDYRIELTPDLTALRFTAREEVDLDVAVPTARFVLDQNGLAIAKARLADPAGAAARVTLDRANQTATLDFPQPVAAGRHTLVVDYAGPIPETPAGIYYDDYQGARGTERMLVTQFESIDARRMFPGWDEPAFKATFRLTVTVPDDLTAISNMPVETASPAGTDAGGGKLKRVAFARTPVMSSYLLALVVGRMDAVRGMAGATDIAVWTASGKARQGDYALQAAERILPFYNEYFGVKYPLPKLDLIAIPGDFDAGAMENWGAITFIDSDLLFDPATSSPGTREDVFEVVAHEMAHQWSGDLVTLGWWDNVWLNEGFANWMEHSAADRFNPDWKVWLRARASKENAMAIDATRSTRALQHPITDESEIDNAFDEISYDKGAAVIRMLETWLGPDAFRNGMRRYMAAHAYSNASAADLWAALAAASGHPVTEIAGSFTGQPGVPLVHAAVRCAGGHTEVTLTQERFTIHDPDAPKLVWQIPMRVGLVGDEARQIVLGADPAQVEFDDCGKPVVANLGDAGYYRVAYDAGDLRRLTIALPTLDAADRAALLGDQWALVEAGKAEVASWLDLTRRLGGETELAVWTPVLRHLDAIDAIERGAADRAAFRDYANGLLRPALERLGWDPKPGEVAEAPLLRSALVASLGRFGDAATLAEARRRFELFEANPATLDPSLAGAVIGAIARSADRAVYDRVRALGRAASGSELKLRYFGALAGARDPALIDQTVALAAAGDVPPGEVDEFLERAAEESDDPHLVWRDVLARLPAITAHLTADKRRGLLPDVAAATADPAIGDQLRAQPGSRDDAGAVQRADQAIDKIAARAELKARLLPAIGAWLRALPKS